MNSTPVVDFSGDIPPGQSSVQTSQILYIAGVIIALAIALAVAVIFIERNNTKPVVSGVQSASAVIALAPDVFLSSQSGGEVRVEGAISITEGDEIRTAEGGEAVLIYPNGTITKLDENTRVHVEALSEDGGISRIAVLGGSMWARVERLLGDGEAYEIRSQGVVTAVRGTEFAFDTTSGSVAVSVLRGEVRLLSGNADETAQEAVISAGERVIALVTDAETVFNEPEPISAEEFSGRVSEHAAVARTVSAGSIASSVLGLDIPESAGAMPGRAFYGLEKALEAIVIATETDANAKALRRLARSGERLRELQALVAAGESGIVEALQDYEESISTALSMEGLSPDTKDRVARTALAHVDILEGLRGKVPEEARAFLGLALNASQQGNIVAVRSLSQDDVPRAFALGVNAQKRALRSAQEHASSGDSLEAFNELRMYDRLVQEADAASELDPLVRVPHARNIAANLRTIEAVNAGSGASSPGVERALVNVRDRSVDSQLAVIAEVALENPEEAVELYSDSAFRYARRARNYAEQRGEAEAAVAVYEKYAAFGEEMAEFAGGIRTGTTTLRELVARASEQHQSVLRDVAERVPEEARAGIERALEASASTRAAAELERAEKRIEDSARTPQGRVEAADRAAEDRRAIEDFVERLKAQRPQGDLDESDTSVTQPPSRDPAPLQQSQQQNQGLEQPQERTPNVPSVDNRNDAVRTPDVSSGGVQNVSTPTPELPRKDLEVQPTLRGDSPRNGN